MRSFEKHKNSFNAELLCRNSKALISADNVKDGWQVSEVEDMLHAEDVVVRFGIVPRNQQIFSLAHPTLPLTKTGQVDLSRKYLLRHPMRYGTRPKALKCKRPPRRQLSPMLLSDTLNRKDSSSLNNLVVQKAYYHQIAELEGARINICAACFHFQVTTGTLTVTRSNASLI